MNLEHGKAFHSFRRFRTSHLRKNRVPWDLQKLWLGHANKDVTDRYAEQLKEDVDWRKRGSRKSWIGVQVAEPRKRIWATWATKTARIEVEESRVTD